MTDIPKPGDGLYLDDLVSTGKPSLGDLAVVSRLVREFVKYVLDIRHVFAGMRKKRNRQEPSLDAIASMAPSRLKYVPGGTCKAGEHRCCFAGRSMDLRAARHEIQPSPEGSRLIFWRKGATR